MDKNKFKIIKGGLDSPLKDENKKFISAFVTNTRLMGVLVLYVKSEVIRGDEKDLFHQFFYIETTEEGIESYKSMYGDDEDSMYQVEQGMIGGLGGDKIALTEREAAIILQQYANMTRFFGKELPEGKNEYGYLLNQVFDLTPMEKESLFRKTCTRIVNDNQLINYFLMRYFSKDFVAANYLCNYYLDENVVPSSRTATLCLNKIEKRYDESEKLSYICESLVEDYNEYSIILTEITLESGLISSFELINSFAISALEAAMKLERPEFVTVYEIMGNRDKIKPNLIKMYPGALKKETDMGSMFLNFINNNDHLKESSYRLNSDVKGIIYVTDENQLVLGAYSLDMIQKLESEIQYSDFGNLVLAIAKYEFKESVFYDFMSSDTGDFLHYIEFISDYDPDDD